MVNLKPGDKRNISFPEDIDQDLLNYLNTQKTLSSTLIRLAREGLLFGHILKNLERRIQILESKLSHEDSQEENVDYMLVLKNAKKTLPLGNIEDDEF